MSARVPRFPSRYDVMLRKGPDIYPGTICNISATGACLMGVEKIKKGQSLTIDYSFGQTRATVTWTAGKLAGVRFDEQMSDSGLQFIRASLNFAS